MQPERPRIRLGGDEPGMVPGPGGLVVHHTEARMPQFVVESVQEFEDLFGRAEPSIGALFYVGPPVPHTMNKIMLRLVTIATITTLALWMGRVRWARR